MTRRSRLNPTTSIHIQSRFPQSKKTARILLLNKLQLIKNREKALSNLILGILMPLDIEIKRIPQILLGRLERLDVDIVRGVHIDAQRSHQRQRIDARLVQHNHLVPGVAHQRRDGIGAGERGGREARRFLLPVAQAELQLLGCAERLQRRLELGRDAQEALLEGREVRVLEAGHEDVMVLLPFLQCGLVVLEAARNGLGFGGASVIDAWSCVAVVFCGGGSCWAGSTCPRLPAFRGVGGGSIVIWRWRLWSV